VPFLNSGGILKRAPLFLRSNHKINNLFFQQAGVSGSEKSAVSSQILRLFCEQILFLMKNDRVTKAFDVVNPAIKFFRSMLAQFNEMIIICEESRTIW